MRRLKGLRQRGMVLPHPFVHFQDIFSESNPQIISRHQWYQLYPHLLSIHWPLSLLRMSQGKGIIIYTKLWNQTYNSTYFSPSYFTPIFEYINLIYIQSIRVGAIIQNRGQWYPKYLLIIRSYLTGRTFKENHNGSFSSLFS